MQPAVDAARHVTVSSLTVLIPALDEEASIGRAVLEAVECGARLTASGAIQTFRVIVVDDGSSDRTGPVVQGIADRRSDVALLRHETNRGLGAAIRTGLAAADTDFVFYTDADLPVDLRVVDRALALLSEDAEVGIVSAYRTNRGGEGPRRYLYSIAYNALVRGLFGLQTRDVNFAAKLMRRTALDGVELRSEGSFIDAELLARLQRRGHRIVQFPADYHPRSKGVSTLSSFGVIRTMVREMRELAPSIRRDRAADVVGT